MFTNLQTHNAKTIQYLNTKARQEAAGVTRLLAEPGVVAVQVLAMARACAHGDP